MMGFHDKVAVVTGGAAGIGQALVRRLSAAGARVVVADLDLEAAGVLAAELPSTSAARLDVRHADAFQALLDEVVHREGRLDYLFNNAGTAVFGEWRDQSLDQIRQVLDVNLGGVVNGCHAAWGIMARQGSGHIVNVASGYGLSPGPLVASYVASKHALVGLSQSLRVEGRGLGIRVSVVCPGFVRTGLVTGLKAINADFAAEIPVPVIEAEEAATRTLRGVSRNQAVIAFPAYVEVLTWAHRLVPGLVWRYQLGLVERFRRARL